MGLILKRSTKTDPEMAKQVNVKKLRESCQELQAPAVWLKVLNESCRGCTGAQSLDITHSSMASRTAQAVY